ncbi:hypothetical protein [Pedobacter chinensis]|nr:hypothetical protein [Pedobacter chinensis]
MKKHLLIFSAAVVIAISACNSDKKSNSSDTTLADSSLIDSVDTDSMGVMDTTNMKLQDSLGNATNPRP